MDVSFVGWSKRNSEQQERYDYCLHKHYSVMKLNINTGNITQIES